MVYLENRLSCSVQTVLDSECLWAAEMQCNVRTDSIFNGNCLLTTPYGSQGNDLSDLCITTLLQLSSSVLLFAHSGISLPHLLLAGLEEQEP